jgi:hypothetical protein
MPPADLTKLKFRIREQRQVAGFFLCPERRGGQRGLTRLGLASDAIFP